MRCILIYCDVYWDFLGIKGEVMSISYQMLKKVSQTATSAAEHEAFRSCATSQAETSQRLRLLKAVSWWQSCGKVQLPSLAPMDGIVSYPMFLTCLILFVLNIDSTVCEDNIHASHSTLLNSLYFFSPWQTANLLVPVQQFVTPSIGPSNAGRVACCCVGSKRRPGNRPQG